MFFLEELKDFAAIRHVLDVSYMTLIEEWYFRIHIFWLRRLSLMHWVLFPNIVHQLMIMFFYIFFVKEFKLRIFG